MSQVFVDVNTPDLFERAAYGLLDAINWITPTGDVVDHWKGGIQYEADCTRTDITMSPCVSGVATPAATKTSTWTRTTRGSIPFTVYDRADCSPIGSDWYETGKNRALRALANSGPISVENILWTGQTRDFVTVYPNLTSTGPRFDETGRIVLQPTPATAITGTPALDITEGVDKLERAFAQCYPGEGWIHVPIGLVEAMCARNLVQLVGGKLYTWAGNRIIVGRGYPLNIGPGGVTAAAGTGFIFMTSPIFGIRGETRAFDPVQSLDRSVNTVQFIAEQTFVLGWHCCLMGVQVTCGGELAGVVGTPGPAT